jgi:hypothetical protein
MITQTDHRDSRGCRARLGAWSWARLASTPMVLSAVAPILIGRMMLKLSGSSTGSALARKEP